MATQKSRHLIPTPLEIAIFLSLLVLILASLFTDKTPMQNVGYWGSGLWSLLSFMTQICLILMGGYVVAASSIVNKILKLVASLPQDRLQVYLFTFVVSTVACLLNWGFGLVVGAFFALEVSRQNRTAHFPLVVASSYIGFIFWHGGISGSIPLLVSTPKSFSRKWMGELIPFHTTVFSFFNLLLILTLFIVLCFLIFRFHRQLDKQKIISFNEEKEPQESQISLGEEESSIFAQVSYWTLLLIMFVYWMGYSVSEEFRFGLNEVNFILFYVGLVLHGGLSQYMATVKKACFRLAPILVQYPIYAGIMGIMIQSGLAVEISDLFVSFSSAKTYPVYMFLSSGLVNLFVPSGGGQWAVQAPVVIQGAQALGVPLWKVVLAVAWGDAWTNLAQPFWALPLLSIVGLSIRDILGYCLQALFVSGLVISLFFWLA